MVIKNVFHTYFINRLKNSFVYAHKQMVPRSEVSGYPSVKAMARVRVTV